MRHHTSQNAGQIQIRGGLQISDSIPEDVAVFARSIHGQKCDSEDAVFPRPHWVPNDPQGNVLWQISQVTGRSIRRASMKTVQPHDLKPCPRKDIGGPLFGALQNVRQNTSVVVNTDSELQGSWRAVLRRCTDRKNGKRNQNKNQERSMHGTLPPQDGSSIGSAHAYLNALRITEG